MQHKYGDFSSTQIKEHKKLIRNKIMFILRNVDPNTKNEFKTQNVDVHSALTNLLYDVSGFNSIMNEPPEIVTVLNLLEEARIALENKSDYTPDEFKVSAFRKLILDAGAETKYIKEV